MLSSKHPYPPTPSCQLLQHTALLLLLLLMAVMKLVERLFRALLE